jgi:hypothetical protein
MRNIIKHYYSYIWHLNEKKKNPILRTINIWATRNLVCQRNHKQHKCFVKKKTNEIIYVLKILEFTKLFFIYN